MKKSFAINKLKKFSEDVEIEYKKKLMVMEAEMDLENRESNRNRAKSFAVGTAFGGTTEIIVRSDGGRHMWLILQPVEVIELIHQLSSNVGVEVELKPRKDFASWRDWRVSEAEKKHLNGHAPFPNDMALVHNLGASGFNEEETEKIMNLIANAKSYANEDSDVEVVGRESFADGAPNIMFGLEDGLVHNKVLLDDTDKVVYMAGGEGGSIEKERVSRKKKKDNI